MSDEKPGPEDGSAAAGPDGVSDAELTDEQLDREAPGVDDAAELEAAEDEIAAEAQSEEDKVVATPARRRGGRITADDSEDDEQAQPR
ncbi:MAG TPA: preprotein translocase subunit SecE, partial [Blastococcus sp.]